MAIYFSKAWFLIFYWFFLKWKKQQIVKSGDTQGSKSHRSWLCVSPVQDRKLLIISSPWRCLDSVWFQLSVLPKEESEELMMATGELNPSHYPAQRAAKVVQHYLNTRYGSPYRLFGLHRVQSASAQVCCWLTVMKLLEFTIKSWRPKLNWRFFLFSFQDVDDTSRNYQLEVEAQEIISNVRIRFFFYQIHNLM